jgi:hypothetical protein
MASFLVVTAMFYVNFLACLDLSIFRWSHFQHWHVSESHHEEDSEEVRKVIDALRVTDQSGGSPGCEGTEAERKAALMQLIRLIREGSTFAVMENFKWVLLLAGAISWNSYTVPQNVKCDMAYDLIHRFWDKRTSNHIKFLPQTDLGRLGLITSQWGRIETLRPCYKLSGWDFITCLFSDSARAVCVVEIRSLYRFKISCSIQWRNSKWVINIFFELMKDAECGISARCHVAPTVQHRPPVIG